MEHDNRTRRLIGRAALRKITTDDRCHDCGRATVGEAVEVRQTPAGVVGLAGLASCGRVWLCPVCNAKVMARRAIEVGAAIAWAQRSGLQLIWGSLTVRHNARSDLGQLLELQRSAWRSVVREKFWARHSATTTVDHLHGPACDYDCERKRDALDLGTAGRVGYIRGSEITIGVNGWHPHFHPLIVYRGTAEQAQAFADRTVEAWVHGVEAAGGEAREVGAQQLLVLDGGRAFDELGIYITKQTYDASSLALELLWAQNKTGAAGRRGVRDRRRAAKTEAHWSILAGIAAGLADDVERWWQLEEAVPGHRMITWSRGLRTFAGLGAESTDEEEAAREVGTREDSVCFITPDGWRSIRDEPVIIGQLLATLEAGGWAGLRVLLDGLRIEYFTLVPAR